MATDDEVKSGFALERIIDSDDSSDEDEEKTSSSAAETSTKISKKYKETMKAHSKKISQLTHSRVKQI